MFWKKDRVGNPGNAPNVSFFTFLKAVCNKGITLNSEITKVLPEGEGEGQILETLQTEV